MRICISQIAPYKGDIQQNITLHKNFVSIASLNNADIIVFPELSLTGYEPELANELSVNKNDIRFNELQEISDTKKIIICAGMPIKSNDDILISMLIFQPDKPRTIYSKQYLHPGEDNVFTTGNNQVFLEKENNKIGFAICYETSVLEHSKHIYSKGANIYIASVLNSIDSINNDINRISIIAKKYKMISFMSNFSGISGGYKCAGKSSIWNTQGELIGQLNSKNQGILIYDTISKKLIKKYL